MSPFLQTVALYAPAVIVFGLALVLATMLWTRGFGEEYELPLSEMMQRLGVAPTEVWTKESARGLAGAARRCASCGAVKACRAWLDSGRREGYEEFCVNAQFIRQLK